MKYPSIVQYIDAINGGRDFFNSLASVRLCTDSAGEPIYCSGNFGVVFCVTIDGVKRALKCFTRAQNGRSRAYAMIENELPRSPYLIDYNYLNDEILVPIGTFDVSSYELINMEWVDGCTLGEAVVEAAKAGDRKSLSRLSHRFDTMALWLLDSGFAHGDLKFENILVTSSGDLRLVDYDGIYLPSMAGEVQREIGSVAYQHPQRSDMAFSPAVDHYSIVLLSFTLRALVYEPQLYALFGREDGAMLFEPADLLAGHCKVYDFLAASTLGSTALYAMLVSPTPVIDGLAAALAERVAIDPNPQLTPFEKDGRWGFCDLSQREIAPIYDHVLPFSEGLAAVNLAGKWGYIDLLGQVVCPFRLDNAWSFADGLAMILYRGKYGFIDHDGKRAVAARYDFARNFSCGLAVVAFKGRYGYIDRQGRWKIRAQYDYAESFHRGVAKVEIEGQQMVISLE